MTEPLSNDTVADWFTHLVSHRDGCALWWCSHDAGKPREVVRTLHVCWPAPRVSHVELLNHFLEKDGLTDKVSVLDIKVRPEAGILADMTPRSP